jgi:amino acid adenylation domain-containing protein
LAGYLEGTPFGDVTAAYEPVAAELARFSEAYLSSRRDPDIEAAYPMSDIEKGMCFIDRAHVDDLLYFEQNLSSIFYKHFDLAVAQRALDLLVEKHEALRTGFDLDAYAHVVYRHLPARIVYRDLSLLPRAGQETTIKRELAASRQAHFDLSAVPLWRIRIYKLSDHYHELVFETHHALFDGWSYSSFIAEFNNTYVALLENKSLRLEKLACGYQDFIVEELYQKKNQETKNYWKAQLKDYKKLTLPAASAEKSFKPVRRHSSAGLVQELGKAAGDRNTTVKTILLAAHLYALKVLSCETDILIGLVTFNRPLKKDGEKLLGCFLNTIPFRVKFPDALTWQAYLALLDEKLLEVKKYESLSLMEIKEAVGIGTSEENPFFDSLFNFINFHVLEGLWRAETTEPQEGTLQLENFLRGNTFFDVNLHVSDGGIYAMYELVSPFMDEENFRNYLQVYDAAVRNIIETPEATLDPVSAYWQAKAAAVTGQLAQYRREVPAAAGGGALLPVSYQQERLWRMYPGGTNRAGQGAKAHQAIHLVIDLAGGVSVARLEESIRAVVRKHSALRTHLVEVDHQPFQRVGDAGAFALPLEVIHPDAAAAHVESIRQRPFEPGKPLFRAVLVRPGAGEYRLVFTLHRLIADGYAADRVWEEIQEAYRGQTGREAIAEERLPLQYGDFARWQRECLSPLGAYLRPYDQSLLGPGPYPARLPLFDPSPAAPAYVDAAVAVAVPRPLARQLTLYGAQTGVEVRVLLLAAYAVLLHKYTQQDDVLVGTAADNRNSELLRDVIGPVEALQWVRSVLAPGLSFGAYAAALAATYRERVRYPVFSPAALAEESFPAPHPGHNAPFSAFYRYEETPAPPGGTGVGRIVARLHPADAGPDLSLLLTQCGDQITGALHYNGARSGSFCPNTLVNHLYGLLEQCLAQPERPLAQTGLASDREKAQILNAFNRTATAYPRDKTIVELFEAQARQTPDWIAVAEGDKRFTYRQLDAQATRIACVLQRHHVRAGEPVAVLADRSADAVAAFIGILKAGGGYLPLDVNHPAGQLEYMLADSGARVVLCQTAYAGRVAAPVTRVDLGTALAEDGGQPVPCPRTPADLAYVMYTSGSTGRPKGVAVTHRNVVRLVKNTTYVPLNENTRILQTGAPAFDATTFEIWGSLLNGGTLCIAPQETLLDSDLLEQALSQYGVNTLWLTSSLFDQHAQANAALFKPLAYLLVGGDALTPRFINHVRSVQPHLVVINGYGPTENTTFSVCHRIDRAYADNIPIGRPISNSTAYIVDGAGNLQPVGVPGELWVGGDGVARGYLNNEALTREKFVPNPFVPGETLYKTGDTAKWLPDGTIVFLGRRDGQVKIRGYRIEPGEIENALLAYGGVKEAVVLVRETNGEKYLIAYYTAAVEVGEAPLTRHLSERLPEYMVPAHCVHLQRLPLTPNGKLDRAALPGPAPKAVTHAAPLSRTQQELLDIWAEVLGRRSEEIGLHSNFFEMGGNSIKLMRMVNRVNQAFQVRIPVARMFKLPAIAAIAEYLTGTPEVPAQSAEADAPDVLQLNETLALMDRLQE